MFQTSSNNQFASIVSGSVVTVLPGTARINNAVIPFDGTSMPVASISGLYGHPNQYQSALLYLEVPDMTATGVDMTSVLSGLSPSITGIIPPQMPNANGFPVGVYTFYTADGVTSQLVSYNGV